MMGAPGHNAAHEIIGRFAGRPGPEGSIGQSMKVLISADMEGTCGVSSWVQVTPSENASAGEPHNQGEYDRARHRMTAEVNAAIEGALEGGADEVIVNDSHDGMRNLIAGLAASLLPVHLRQRQATEHDAGG